MNSVKLEKKNIKIEQKYIVNKSLNFKYLLKPIGKYVLLMAILFFYSNADLFAQCTISVISGGTTTVTSPATIYDPGGTSNYTSNLNVVKTYTAPAGNVLTINFTAFNTENGYDFMYLYDGTTAITTPILTKSGSGLPSPTSYTSTGQSFTIKFTSDNSTVGSGYVATLTCVPVCSNTTVGGTIEGVQTVCGSYNPTNITSSIAASGGSGTVSYQWESSINNSTWTDISGATSATYDPPTITQTTYYRRESKNSGCTPWGAISNTITKTVLTTPTAYAGLDQTQCYNGAFELTGNTPLGGQTGLWTVVSGSPLWNQSMTNPSVDFSIAAGATATLRYTVTNGTCSASDDLVISNTTSCATSCTGELNINGDLENEGNATNFNLTFQGTPAQLISKTNPVPGWAEGYGAAVPNNTTFYGAYYLNKTGSQGNPKSGTHMVYIGGANGYCLSAFANGTNLSCGKQYKISAWIAAFSNTSTQSNAPFSIEFFAGNSAPTPTQISPKLELVAPASTSWNNLNWQRYEFIVTIPENNFTWSNFVFTPSDNINGIVVDDACVTEVQYGSYANAGPDIYGCSSAFTMAANIPPVGYTGTWTVTRGSATITSPNSATSNVSITSGNNATLKWTVSNGTCTSFDNVTLASSNSTPIIVNNASICIGSSTTLTATGGCTGNLLWSTGATTNSININPANTTIYTVSCTPPSSTNLALNPGFEASSSTDWSEYPAGTFTITTIPSEVRTGTKAAKINATTEWSSINQEISISPSNQVIASFWAKATNPNTSAEVGIQFLNSSYSLIDEMITVRVKSTNWQKYTVTGIAPLTSSFVQPIAFSNSPSILFIDDVEVYSSTGCVRTGSGTVTVNSIPTITSTTAASKCGPGSVSLIAISASNINWFTTPTGGTSIFTGTTFTTPILNSTTTYYVEADNGICSSSVRTDVVATIRNNPIANAGPDVTNCNNSFFELKADPLLPGQSGQWSIVSGTAYISDFYNPQPNTMIYGSTAVLRWTLNNSNGCSLFDDVALTNNTACSTPCTNAINTNGDLEDEGPISSFNLSLNGTPAVGLLDLRTPPGWSQRYGGGNIDSINFLGAFLVKNNNNTANPHSGENMVYMNGTYCYSTYLTTKNISCGKKYKVSAWVGAYTYNASQTSSTFYFEASITGGSSLPFLLNESMVAPASTSWSNINWKRFEIEFEIPNYGYNNFDFYFTSALGSGILIDDVCITEISKGAEAYAGEDLYQCGTNNFTMNANTPTSGYSGSWVSKEGNINFTSPNSPTSNATITSGNVGTAYWTIGNGVCKDTNEVVLSKLNYKQNKVVGDTICVGESATVSSLYCTGDISWSNGSTSSSFSISPATTTSYIGSCTQYTGPELIKNPSFELSPDLIHWNPTSNVLIVSNPADVVSGSKAIKLNSLSSGEYLYQNVDVQEGKMYMLSFWAKAINTNTLSEIYYQFKNSSGNIIGKEENILLNSTSYQKYTKILVAPPYTAEILIGAWSKEKNIAFFDNISLKEYSNCPSSDTARVLVYNNPLQLSTPIVSSCIPNTFTSGATVDVTVSWTQSIPGDKIKVQIGRNNKYIDVAAGATSPVTVRFYIQANGSTGNEVKASWNSLNETGCIAKAYFNAPVPCITRSVDCDVLYLFSDYNEADGEPFDQGFSAFSSSITTGTVTKAFTKTGTGMRLFDPNNRNTLLNLNLDNYKFIVISPTVEARTSTTLKSALRDFKGSILNMCYDLQTALGYTSNINDYIAENKAYLSNGTLVNPLNYQNINPTNATQYITGSDIKPSGIPLLWFDQASVGTMNKVAIYTFPAHSISGVTTYHGPRAYAGITIDGFYSNASNGGAIPAPSTEYFVPQKHLDYDVNRLFEQAILSTTNCSPELCFNNIDDDGDGLVDCLDPDCGQIKNREFDVNLNDWALSNTAPAVSALTLDATSKLSGRNSARINITTATTVLTNIKFSQANIAITNGKKYRITFRARSSSSRTISSTIVDGSNTTTIYNTVNHNLLNTTTVASNTFSYIFTSTITNNNASLIFNVGTAIGDIYIDDIRFEEVCCPIILTTTPASICGTGIVTLGATANSGTINWYTMPTGGSSIGTGNSFTTPSISATTIYYVDATSAGCAGDARIPVTATVLSSPPSITTTTPKSICGPGSVTLEATASAGTINWYAASTGGSSLGTGTSFITPSISSSTIYYVDATNGACVTSSRTGVTATVNTIPIVSNTGSSNICAGSTTTLSPTTGGTWTSSNTAVATVTNAGVVTGVSGGTATFTFTNSSTLCPSDATSTVTVTARPTTNITSSNTSLCIGGTTTASPTTLGTWASSNTAVATITNAGLITAVNAGTATFTYTLTSSGCSSMATAPFTVNVKPSVSITGSSTICAGSTTTLSPTTGAHGRVAIQQ